MQILDLKTKMKIDPTTGEILSPLKWDTGEARYYPAPQQDLSVWELHLIAGSPRLRKWAHEGAKQYKKGWQ